MHVEATMRRKQGNGLVLINCMEKLTMNAPKETLKVRMTAALDAGIDGITLAAGLHLGSFALIEDHPRFRDAKLGIIVSSVRALQLFLKKSSRTNRLPDYIVVDALFRAERGEPGDLVAKMDDQLARRDASQPTKDLTAGSTFRNPAGFSSTGQADDTHELKAWKVIDDAGLRGATRGGAMMSKKHPNFLTNTGTATAADLEGLGEDVREKVAAHSGITLEWEIMRVGEPASEAEQK